MKKALSILVFAVGCFNPVGTSDREELRRAQAHWERQGINSYTFEMRTSCFCPPEMLDWAVVEVRDDEILSVTMLDGTPASGWGLSSRKTVDELFALGRRKPESWVAELDFEFDDALGYPTRMSFISKRNIADAGITYEARNLRPL